MKLNSFIEKNATRIQTVIIAISCIFLIIQYLSNRALWIDESAVALNILNRDYLGLLKPLDYGQLTPLLFLLISKFNFSLVSHSELGLRLFSLLSFIASLLLVKKLISIFFKSYTVQIIVLSLFAFNLSYIYFASEFKQYIVDVFVCLSILNVNFKTFKTDNQKYITICALYILAILLSHVAILIIFSMSIYHLFSQWQVKKINRTFFISHLIFMMVYGLFYLKFMYHHPLQGALAKYWQNCFLPINSISAFTLFFKHKFSMIFADFFQFGKWIGAFLMILFTLGIFSTIKKKNYTFFIITILPIITHLVLSALKAYPFDLRLILYLTPLIIFLIGAGLEFLIVKLKFLELSTLSLAFLPLIFIGLKTKNGTYPIKREEMKSTYEFLQKNIKKEDNILVFWQSDYTYQFYKRIGVFNLANKDCAIELNDIKSDTLKMNASNNWLIFTHLTKETELNLLQKLTPDFKFTSYYRTTGSSLYLIQRVTKRK
jgi:hypothetical protein